MYTYTYIYIYSVNMFKSAAGFLFLLAVFSCLFFHPLIVWVESIFSLVDRPIVFANAPIFC